MTAGRDTAALTITNPKLASLAPTWRRYRGVSVLFDNPATRADPGVAPLADLAVADVAAQRLYDELAAALDDDLYDLRERFGLCPLPRASYHVTVCDGPNEHHGIAAIAPLLDGLPGTLSELDAQLPLLTRAPVLTAAASTPLTLRVSDVAVWGHVLAARLAPADDAARVTLERVGRARDELADGLWRDLRLRSQRWRPHVSLAYFPNRTAADAARAALPRGLRALPERLRCAVTFRSAAVYGFTDMASFFRLGR